MSKTLVSLRTYKNSLFIRHTSGENQCKLMSPVLYQESDTPSKYKSITGMDLEPVQCDSTWDMRDKLKAGTTQYYGQSNLELYYLCGLNHDAVVSDLDLRALDIEVDAPEFPKPEEALWPITCISVVTKTSKMVFSLDVWEQSKSIHESVRYIHCSDELDLLQRFMNYWSSDYPDVVTGWNTDGFDLPYIHKRIEQLLPERLNDLSPFGIVEFYFKKGKYGSDEPRVDWLGVESLDLHQLYGKFAFQNLPTYSLEYVSNFELGEGKLEFTGTHSDFRANDPQRYVDYCIRDSELCLRLNDKLQLIELACNIAWRARINLGDVYSPVKTWDAILTRNLKLQNIYPPISDPVESGNYVGAYVKPVAVGLHDWVLSFDVTSLYPSLIMQYNMCFSTIKDGSVSKNSVEALLADAMALRAVPGYSMAANTVQFDTSFDGFLPVATREILDSRQSAKKAMQKLKKSGGDPTKIASLNTMQMAMKILANSLYGGFANRFFRFYDLRIAEAITTTGQYVIQRLERKVNTFLTEFSGIAEHCIAMDTDSIYLTLGSVVKLSGAVGYDEEFAKVREWESKITKVIDEECQQIFLDYNCKNSDISLKREAIAVKGLWLATKKYALNVADLEGLIYDPPRLKTTGLAPNMGTVPVASKPIVQAALELVLRSDEPNRLADKVTEWYEDWKLRPLAEIGKPSKIGQIEKWWLGGNKVAKKCHVNVRAAVATNFQQDKDLLKSQDRALMIELQLPNPFDSDIVALPFDAPETLLTEVEKYVNRDAMFVKAVDAVLGRIASAAKLSLVKVYHGAELWE